MNKKIRDMVRGACGGALISAGAFFAIEYMENGCKMKEVYKKRVDEFFAFNDKNNCERLYQRITELEKIRQC